MTRSRAPTGMTPERDRPTADADTDLGTNEAQPLEQPIGAAEPRADPGHPSGRRGQRDADEDGGNATRYRCERDEDGVEVWLPMDD